MKKINDALSKSDDVHLQVWGKQYWARFAQSSYLPKQDGVVTKKRKEVLKALEELKDLIGA